MNYYIFFVFITAILGCVLGWLMAKFLLKKFLHNPYKYRETPEDINEQTKRQCQIIFEEATRTAEEQLELEAKRTEEERQVLVSFQENFEQNLSHKQSELDKLSNSLDSFSESLSQKENEIQLKEEKLVELKSQQENLEEEFQKQLEIKANLKRNNLITELSNDMLNDEQLSISKWSMEYAENIKYDSQKMGKEILSIIYSRYCPTFLWPKNTYNIPIPSTEILEKHFINGNEVLQTLIQPDSLIATELIYNKEKPDEQPSIKLIGGSGTSKEIIKLTLEEMFEKNNYNHDFINKLIQKNKKAVEKFILKLGDDAAKSLGLENINPELLKLVGSLNFRTSHRQNQYYHSIEVARLAGMLADELGIDSTLAKRAGLLHDIGKSEDYRIEGSHAVISANFAEQYGETPEVIEIVISHHDDKIVETTHAFVLKAADALSGARPGARVDMEEGYHNRIDAIAQVINSFSDKGVVDSAIMHAGREVHVFVDNRKIKERDTKPLAQEIVRKLESDVEFPGQIRVTVVRRLEVTEVA